ncbi:hypothetical protein [Bowmanella yangjiangensis]|uniref:Hemerythrin-like domain-containing protein n=1 Tax=Bowmanella yangjiangensis TaxID=2811230 RepID=A0ABS3CQZ5_9ALTE|nr:hypothetical protein [Bowmanella yangjiangensis]MBN7819470.1 hypothetical protein [Bowmanella yangjiangensis]
MYCNRYNIYTLIHKALRASMCDTLVILGSLDDTDPQEIKDHLELVSDLLTLCQHHLEHENHFIHEAIQRQNPHLHIATVQEHQEHEYCIRKLSTLIAQCQLSNATQQQSALLTLYRELALFIADNFEHMHVEETHNTQMLWDLFSDEEIHQIEQQIVGAMEPIEQQRVLIMILTHISHTERLYLLLGMRQHAPADVFNDVLSILQLQLPASHWQKLSSELIQAA